DPNEPDAEPLRTCVIITTEANELLATVHERMPVVLPPSAWDTWLDPGVSHVDTLLGLLKPAASADFVVWPVRRLVNKATNEGPELIEPIAEDEDEDRAAEELVDALGRQAGVDRCRLADGVLGVPAVDGGLLGHAAEPERRRLGHVTPVPHRDVDARRFEGGRHPVHSLGEPRHQRVALGRL